MQRYLVAINYDGPHERLAAEMRALALADDAQFHIVVPAVERGNAHSEGEQRAIAHQLLDSIESAIDDKRSGTIVSGTAASKATEAALSAYPGGVVDRVVKLSDGEYEVHYIGVNWPHHIFVNQSFKVVGAN